jgi:toxin ParE1/3/4
MVKIVWTDSAIQDLNDIGDYIEKDSFRYAEITVFELFESVDILEIYPKAGTIVPEFKDDSIRQIVRGNYRIVYQFIGEFRIEILTVHNCARLLSNISPFKVAK